MQQTGHSGVLRRLCQPVKKLALPVLGIMDRYYDWRLGIDTCGVVTIKGRDDNLSGDAYDYGGTRYFRVLSTIKALDLHEEDVMVDFGCGKGRVLVCAALFSGVGKVIGVDFMPEMVAAAQENIVRRRLQDRVQVVQGDASTFVADDATVYYFFNPFGDVTLTRVIENIKDGLGRNFRQIRVVFHAHSGPSQLLRECGWLVPAQSIGVRDVTVWRNVM